MFKSVFSNITVLCVHVYWQLSNYIKFLVQLLDLCLCRFLGEVELLDVFIWQVE